MADALITGVANLVLFGLVVVFRRLVHREGPDAFLLHGDESGRRLFLRGSVAGLLVFMIYPAFLVLSGQGRMAAGEDVLPTTIMRLLVWGAGFLPLALFEEALFRGYLMRKLQVRGPLWVAVVLPSLLFGAIHVVTYGSGGTVWLGLVNAGIFGVAMSFIVLGSRSLMGAVGFHWAWNVAQKALLSEPNDGIDTFVDIRARDGAWTGWLSEPDTGLIVTVIYVTLTVVVALRKRTSPPPP